MFAYVTKFPRNHLVSHGSMNSRVFEPSNNGKVILTDNLKVIASKFDDYSLNSLIAAGVDVSKGSEFETTDLNTHDSVDENVSKILESESINSQSVNENEK